MNKSSFLVPSTYGVISWIIVIIFVIFDPVGMYPISLYGWLIIVYTILVFAFFTITYHNKFTRIKIKEILLPSRADTSLFILSTIIGTIGLFIYTKNILSYYGNASSLLHIIYNSALQIRGDAEEFSSLAVQLSYFSWISIFIGSMLYTTQNIKPKYKIIILSIILLETCLNLLFIDRTRPVWILFTVGMGFIFSKPVNIKSLRKIIVCGVAFPLIIFVTFSIFVQKYNEDYGIFGTMIAYIISGPGYLDSLLNDSFNIHTYELTRTFFPVSKALHSLGILSEIPKHVLENRYIPFPTNVGTIHEPYLSDGGLAYLILIFPVLVLFINHIAYIAYKSRTLIGIFLWANCTFVITISFFVPKFNSTPFYIIIFVYLFMKYITNNKKN